MHPTEVKEHNFSFYALIKSRPQYPPPTTFGAIQSHPCQTLNDQRGSQEKKKKLRTANIGSKSEEFFMGSNSHYRYTHSLSHSDGQHSSFNICFNIHSILLNAVGRLLNYVERWDEQTVSTFNSTKRSE